VCVCVCVCVWRCFLGCASTGAVRACLLLVTCSSGDELAAAPVLKLELCEGSTSVGGEGRSACRSAPAACGTSAASPAGKGRGSIRRRAAPVWRFSGGRAPVGWELLVEPKASSSSDPLSKWQCFRVA
jgi:hypothetical protein